MSRTVPRSRALAWRRVHHVALALIACLALSAPAFAVSIRDLVALSQAGLSDDVLIALMEADGTVFPLDAPRILELREQGLSERVITAMIKNGPRERESDHVGGPAPIPADPVAETPSLVVIGDTPPEPAVVQTTVVVVPWVPFVAGPIVRPHPGPTLPGYRGFGRFINDGWINGRPPSGAR